MIYFNQSASVCVYRPIVLINAKNPNPSPIGNRFGFLNCGGRGWIRTTEVSDNRFTVCPLWPLGNSPTYIISLMVFRQQDLLYHISYLLSIVFFAFLQLFIFTYFYVFLCVYLFLILKIYNKILTLLHFSRAIINIIM